VVAYIDGGDNGTPDLGLSPGTRIIRLTPGVGGPALAIDVTLESAFASPITVPMRGRSTL